MDIEEEQDPSLLPETSPSDTLPDDDDPLPPGFHPDWRRNGPLKKDGSPRAKRHSKADRIRIVNLVSDLLACQMRAAVIKRVLRIKYGLGWRSAVQYIEKAQAANRAMVARQEAVIKLARDLATGSKSRRVRQK